MDHSAAAAPTSIQDSLRENPTFAGVTDDVLGQIASLVSNTTTQKISESLRKVQLFEGLSDDDVLQIQQVAETVVLSPGEILFEEGKKGDTFYVVLRGRVELTKRGRDGVEQKLAVAREGEAFGEMALLNQTPRSATARTLEAANLLEISREVFDSLLGGDSFAVRMLRGISRALWATSVRFASNQAKGSDAREVMRSLSQVMQKSILPAGIPQVSGFSVMAYTAPHERAGGESAWDWFGLGDGRFVFALLRAHSEGLPAGYPLVFARTLLRELGKDQLDLGKLLARVNEALIGARVAGAPQHVECALIALHDGELTWAAAGPVAAAIVRGGGSVVDLPRGSAAAGDRAWGVLPCHQRSGDAGRRLPGARSSGERVAGPRQGRGRRDAERRCARDGAVHRRIHSRRRSHDR